MTFSLLEWFRKPKPRIIILTPWGPVTEGARRQAALNMRADPELRKRVEEHLVKEMGSVAEGLAEAQRRYPEAYKEE
jgi:hypothetical protein